MEKGEGWRGMEGEGWEEWRGEDGEGWRGEDGEEWRGDGMEWSEGGRGRGTHSPGLVVARVRSCALAIVREPWWPCWLVVVRARCGSWLVGDGEGRSSPFWGSRWWGGRRCWVVVAACGPWAVVVVVVACVGSWVLGVTCGRWRLVVVVLDWGEVVSGWSSSFSWAVRVVTFKRRSTFVNVPRRWTCACLACDVAATSLSSWLVVVVSGW